MAEVPNPADRSTVRSAGGRPLDKPVVRRNEGLTSMETEARTGSYTSFTLVTIRGGMGMVDLRCGLGYGHRPDFF